MSFKDFLNEAVAFGTNSTAADAVIINANKDRKAGEAVIDANNDTLSNFIILSASTKSLTYVGKSNGGDGLIVNIGDKKSTALSLTAQEIKVLKKII